MWRRPLGAGRAAGAYDSIITDSSLPTRYRTSVRPMSRRIASLAAPKTFAVTELGCVLPDPMMDGKINAGYKGHDQFSLMEGFLLDKFPIYKAGDDQDKPSGGTRVILYQLVPDEGDRFKFQKVRNYDTH